MSNLTTAQVHEWDLPEPFRPWIEASVYIFILLLTLQPLKLL